MKLVLKKDSKSGSSRKTHEKRNGKLDEQPKIGPSKELSSDTDFKAAIRQIQLLVGVSHADFQFLYVETIKNLSISYEALFNDMLKTVIKALRQRRGYLLPIGSESEVSFREHEVWTYAVFTASILNFILLNVSEQSLATLKTIIPLAGLLWLKRYPESKVDRFEVNSV